MTQELESIEEPRLRPRRWSWRNRFFLLFGTLALGICTLFLWRYFSSYESTDDAQVDVHLHPVSARIRGHVTRVNVDDNEYVKKGTVLVEIDPKDYQVAVDQAKADLATAEAAAESLHIDVPITATTTSSQLDSTAADVDKNRAADRCRRKATHGSQGAARASAGQRREGSTRPASLQDARRRRGSVSTDLRRGPRGSESEHRHGRSGRPPTWRLFASPSSRRAASLTSAQANHRAAQTAPKQVAATRARALSAQATVDQKRAALEQAKLNLLYTRMTAPVTGQVNKTVVPGMNVQPGQQLLTVVPLDDVWITANFKETQLRHIHPGQQVEVYVDSTGRTYRGPRRQHRRSDGSAVQSVSSRKRHRQLRQDRAAGPHEDRHRAGQNHDRQLRPGVNVAPKVFLR